MPDLDLIKQGEQGCGTGAGGSPGVGRAIPPPTRAVGEGVGKALTTRQRRLRVSTCVRLAKGNVGNSRATARNAMLAGIRPRAAVIDHDQEESYA
jgi:hypothetical protein